jgi:hypothetical protein
LLQASSCLTADGTPTTCALHFLHPVSICSAATYVAAAAAALQVIYAQTDSVFIHFPSASAAEAVALGQRAAQLVTQQLPPPIELKYERVMCPFMLLHVNRWGSWSKRSPCIAMLCPLSSSMSV